MARVAGARQRHPAPSDPRFAGANRRGEQSWREVARTFRAFVAVVTGAVAFSGSDLGGPLAAMWSGIVAAVEANEADQHRQSLAFLKAAYDRLEAQIRSGPNRPGVISLRSEQAAVMQRIRAVVL